MTNATTQATTATVGFEFADVDPRTLTVETNVRVAANIDKEFVASIRDLGVLQPVLAVRENGALRARAGQRRTLAAIEAGLATIPARLHRYMPDPYPSNRFERSDVR